MPDYDTEVTMIGSGRAVADLIDRVAAAATKRAQDKVSVLLERKRVDDPSADVSTAYDSRYYSELVRRERYDVDGQLVRRYFPFARVCQGRLDVTGRLLGLEWTPVAAEDAGSWHPDVASCDVASTADASAASTSTFTPARARTSTMRSSTSSRGWRACNCLTVRWCATSAAA